MEIPKNATKLDLSHRGLSKIPKEVFQCTYLQKLNLSHNRISSIPKEINNLTHLRNLDLSDNNIHILYAKLFELKKLEVLLLNNNKIKSIPELIFSLTKLRKLGISSNYLKNLPKNINELKGLIMLDISNNDFSQFPVQILQLKALKNIWLGRNNFVAFPVGNILNDLPNLNSIYCFNSKVTEEVDVDHHYLSLQRVRGNCLKTLKILKNISENKLPTKSSSNVVNKNRRIFISYSHKDARYKDEVEITLKQLKNLGIDFNFWVDTQLKSGDKMEQTIVDALKSSGVAINIISRDYIGSSFIHEKELPTMLEKAEKEGMLILNLIVRQCRFTDTKLKDFVCVNDPNYPMQSLLEHEQEFFYDKLAQDIKAHFSSVN